MGGSYFNAVIGGVVIGGEENIGNWMPRGMNFVETSGEIQTGEMSHACYSQQMLKKVELSN